MNFTEKIRNSTILMPIKKGHDTSIEKLSDCEQYKFTLWFLKLRNTEKTLESGQVETMTDVAFKIYSNDCV
jgi:hypothetical protein